MSGLLLWLIPSLLQFSATILLLTIANGVWFAIGRILTRTADSGQGPRVSVLVPARDEERGIATCVQSLCTQSYANTEVIVLNDSSTDSTGEILERLSAQYNNLRIVGGSPLPEGWGGKNWACHQLAQEACGDIMIFTDADTLHHPDTVSECVYDMTRSNLGFRTGVVGQQVITWGERISVPIMNWSVITFFPSWLMPALGFGSLGAAHGQFMAFTRHAYAAVGGHEAVKGSVLDDIGLAARVQASGTRWAYRDLGRRVSCRMYTGFSEAWNGFGKNLFAVFEYRLLPYLFIWTYILAMCTVPLVCCFHPDPVMARQALATAVILLAQFAIVFGISGMPVGLAMLYPIHAIVWWLLAMNSLVSAATGRAQWKGRQLAGGRLRIL